MTESDKESAARPIIVIDKRKRLALALCHRDCALARAGRGGFCAKPCDSASPCDGWRHWLGYADAAISVPGFGSGS